MFGLDRAALKIVAIFLAVVLLCLVGFGISYCSRSERLKEAKADAAISAGRTGSAVEAINTIGENTAANAATHEEVEDAQDAIRNAAPADRERVARCRLRELQGLPAC